MTMDSKQARIIIAGFGGQGIVLAGNIIARACVMENKHVTGMVSYGAEMRGGTANATVIVSDEEIASPFVDRPNMAIILNQPSLDKFENRLVSGGLAVINSTLITRDVIRGDIDVVKVNALEIARWLGNERVANMVALGAFIKRTGILKASNIAKAIEQLFAMKKVALVAINKKALKEGMKAAAK